MTGSISTDDNNQNHNALDASALSDALDAAEPFSSTSPNDTRSSRFANRSRGLGASERDGHVLGEPRWGMRDPLVPIWTQATLTLHHFLGQAVTTFSLHAVRNPKTYLGVITFLSMALAATGLFTNFVLELDLDAVFTPIGSRPQEHHQWIMKEGFPNETRVVQMIFHANGANVLHTQQARRVFEAIETFRSTPGYYDLCNQGNYYNFENERTCRIMSVSGYWANHSVALFDEQVGNDNNNELFRFLISQKEFADTSPVLHDLIVGNYVRNNETRQLESAQSYMVQLEMPNKDDTNKFEREMLQRMADLRNDWIGEDKGKEYGDPTLLTVDIMTVYAYQLELLRTIIGDMYLVPICLLLMVGFTCMLFAKFDDKVQSRAMLGLGSVMTISCSMMTGNGLMFLFGVPYSAVHQMLPFVVLGIGLDDTFIITGAYFRTNPKDPIELRIRQTMEEVGPSITLTTFTTVFAFFLGRVTSSLPGVHWLCLYAMSIIAIDFYYQITYFVAIVVLDERRIQANRKDCCFWVVVETEDEDNENIKHDKDSDKMSDEGSEMMDGNGDDKELTTIPTLAEQAAEQPAVPIPVRFMRWYSEFLMRPHVKIAVLVIFGSFFALCCYSATLLEQHFNVADYVSPDSYLYTVFSSLDDYSSVVRPMGVYFRNIDQMDADMQKQMIAYVDELEQLDQIGATNVSLEEAANSDEIRPFCWVRDLQEIEKSYADDPTFQAVFADMTFSEKLDFAMKDKVFREVYGANIVRDEHGNITASRCFLFLKNLDLENVHAQVDMLFDQREVTMAQPINNMPQHADEWAMFSFNDLFFYWEAYAVAVDELILTIISGVVSVTLISFIFIPHWSAACFVLPMIMVLYINLLGTIRFFGLDINGLTYICVVVAIGLLVDFLMHVLLRYYEARPDQTREDRVKETLQTMGISIMVGGLTTLVGVLPLVFSSVNIFLTVFYAFFAMITLGVSHGLILMPVILSYVGPTMCVRGHHLATPPDFTNPSPPSARLSSSRRRSSLREDKSERQTSVSATNEASVDVDTTSASESPSASGSFDLNHWLKNVTDEVEV